MDVLFAADPNRDGSRRVLAQIGEAGFAEFHLPVPPAKPPVAAAGPDLLLECDGALSAAATLDGSRSYDGDSSPESGNDIVSWTWRVGTTEVGTGERADVRLPLGANRVALVVDDRTSLTDRDWLWATVTDQEPPTGRIIAPLNGSCIGPSGIPVVIEDSFLDRCDPEPSRSYEPQGPDFNKHGDHAVRLTVRDASGNPAEDTVRFTVDTISPSVKIYLSSLSPIFVPGGIDLDRVFATSDSDGASGEVTRERIGMIARPEGEACVLLDGAVDGDRDGILSDETVRLDRRTLCLAMRRCGFSELSAPALWVSAEDCGGNSRTVFAGLGGAVTLVPAICDAGGPTAGPLPTAEGARPGRDSGNTERMRGSINDLK